MTQTPREQPKQPMGKAIEWSDEQLDALSQISDADLLLAVEMWKRDLPLSGLRDLLDAAGESEPSPLITGRGTPIGRF